MTTGIDLLKKLGSGVLPSGVAGATGALGRANVAASGFADLLSAASTGVLSSGRPVTPEKGVEPVLSEEQLARLGAIADKAEASGASRVLVQMDGGWWTLDVGARSVRPAAAPERGEVLTGVDAVVREPGPAGPVGPPSAHDLLKKLGSKR